MRRMKSIYSTCLQPFQSYCIFITFYMKTSNISNTVTRRFSILNTRRRFIVFMFFFFNKPFYLFGSPSTCLFCRWANYLKCVAIFNLIFQGIFSLCLIERLCAKIKLLCFIKVFTKHTFNVYTHIQVKKNKKKIIL